MRCYWQYNNRNHLMILHPGWSRYQRVWRDWLETVKVGTGRTDGAMTNLWLKIWRQFQLQHQNRTAISLDTHARLWIFLDFFLGLIKPTEASRWTIHLHAKSYGLPVHHIITPSVTPHVLPTTTPHFILVGHGTNTMRDKWQIQLLQLPEVRQPNQNARTHFSNAVESPAHLACWQLH